MKNFTIKLLLLLIILFQTSCKQSNDIFNAENIINHNYKGAPIKLYGELYNTNCYGFNNMLILKDYIIFNFWYNHSTLLAICDKRSGNIISDKILQKGRGPEEFFMTEFITAYNDTLGINAWFEADAMDKIVCFNVQKSLEDKKPYIEHKSDTKIKETSGAFIVHIKANNDQVYILSNPNEKRKLVIQYGSLSHKLDTIGYLYNKPLDLTLTSSSYSFGNTNPYCILGMLYFNGVYFYSLTPNQQSFYVSVYDKKVKYDDIKNINYDGLNTYYLSSFSTDDYVCLLYNSNGERQLHLLNYDGSIKEIYAIDEKIDQIFYDKFENTIYGLERQNEKIYKYRLS